MIGRIADQPPVGRGHQQGDRIAGRGQQQRCGRRSIAAHRIGDAGQRAEHEIAAPSRPTAGSRRRGSCPRRRAAAAAGKDSSRRWRPARGRRGDLDGASWPLLASPARSSSGQNQHRPVALVGDIGRDRAAHFLGRQRAIVGEIGADMLDLPRARAIQSSSASTPVGVGLQPPLDARSPPDSAPARTRRPEPDGRRGRRRSRARCGRRCRRALGPDLGRGVEDAPAREGVVRGQMAALGE